MIEFQKIKFKELKKDKEYFFIITKNKIKFTVLVVDVQQICVRMAWNEMKIFDNDNEKVFFEYIEG